MWSKKTSNHGFIPTMFRLGGERCSDNDNEGCDIDLTRDRDDVVLFGNPNSKPTTHNSSSLFISNSSKISKIKNKRSRSDITQIEDTKMIDLTDNNYVFDEKNIQTQKQTRAKKTMKFAKSDKSDIHSYVQISNGLNGTITAQRTNVPPVPLGKGFIRNTADFQLKLRQYQENGVRWMNVRNSAQGIKGGILADEMGLGKTIQTIVMIAENSKIGDSVLIVMPVALLAQWHAEIIKFTVFQPIIFHGNNRRYVIENLRKDQFNIILTTYGVLVEEDKLEREVTNFHGTSVNLNLSVDLGANTGARLTIFQKYWSCVILDEGHEIRTAKTKRHKMILKLRGGCKWVLTGTPIQNSAKDFIALLRFLGIDKDRLDDLKRQITSKLRQKDALRVLKGYASRLMLRRTKEDVPEMLNLPKKTMWLSKLNLNESEQEIYNALYQKCQVQFNTFVKEGTVLLNYAKILVLINRLRRAACHPLLGISREDRVKIANSDIAPSSKITALLGHIKKYKAQNRKIVVFSQWTSFLDIIQVFLDKFQITFTRYDGKMSIKTRNENLVNFKTNPNITVILVSLKAGGVGLNLCEGSVVLFVDHWWNSATEDQATDRIHRIGQTLPVDVIKFTTRNTIEENVLTLQAKKKIHEEALFGDEQKLNSLNIQDLKLLFKLPENIQQKVI